MMRKKSSWNKCDISHYIYDKSPWLCHSWFFLRYSTGNGFKIQLFLTWLSAIHNQDSHQKLLLHIPQCHSHHKLTTVCTKHTTITQDIVQSLSVKATLSFAGIFISQWTIQSMEMEAELLSTSYNCRKTTLSSSSSSSRQRRSSSPQRKFSTQYCNCKYLFHRDYQHHHQIMMNWKSLGKISWKE
jgi:hypothetical protein